MKKIIKSLREIAEVLYLSLGLNIVAYKNHSKRPIGPWKKFQTERQAEGEALSFPWHLLTGLGIVLGPVGNIHAFDVDQSEDFAGIEHLLKLMGLSPQYPWLVQSGSGVGWHIYFTSNKLLEEFGGERVLVLTKSPIKCKQIELRISGLIVAPGSSHKSGKKYAFRNENNFDRPLAFIEPGLIRQIVQELDPSVIPNKAPKTVEEEKVAEANEDLIQPNPRTLERVLDCLEQATEKNLDISTGYLKWRDCGFAIANEFGESGRTLFHEFSKLSSKYDEKECDKAFNNYVKAQSQERTNRITLGTFFYLFAQVGIKPRINVREELRPKKANAFHDAQEIIHSKFKVSRDQFTDTVFIDGEPLEDRHINDMYVFLRARYNFKSIRKDDIVSMLESSYVDVHHRILDIIKSHTPIVAKGNIKKLRDTLGTETGASLTVEWHGENRPFLDVLIEVYLVKMVKGFFEKEINDIVLVLLGGMHLGKTHWVLHLLPDEVSDLCRITQFTMDKDFKTLLTNSAILNIDEVREKDMNSNEYMKQIITTSSFPLRLPYGRKIKMRKRIATLAGTGNNPFILRDVTGNRRFFPVWLDSLDRNGYNRISKKDLLCEIYDLYKSGYDTRLDPLIPHIATVSKDFEVRTEADELLLQHCPPFDPTHPEVGLLSVREMGELLLERTKRTFNFTQLGLAVDRLGYEGKVETNRTYNGKLSKVWKYYCDPTGTLGFKVKSFQDMLDEPMPISTMDIQPSDKDGPTGKDSDNKPKDENPPKENGSLDDTQFPEGFFD